MNFIGWTVIAGLVAIALVLLLGLFIEWQYWGRDGNQLELDAGNWELTSCEPKFYQLQGQLVATNYTDKLDVFLIDVKAEVTLLSKETLADVTHTITIKSRHPNAVSPRHDNYWEAYIVNAGKSTGVDITIDIQGQNLAALQTAWVKVHYTIYGPEGQMQKIQHCIVPLQFPDEKLPERWRPTANADVLPIRTHLLSTLDTPIEVIQRYVSPHAQPGDIVTIGETPVAIMQGRYRHPSDVKPGWLAKRLCYYFLPTSSLATACGLQVLVDESGAWRVAIAFILGALAKVFLRLPGRFYVLAGEQARLIDDVSGTLPPYDQFIVLGPEDPQTVVEQIFAETGLEAAIVDVNDLKKVGIVAATAGVSPALLNQALLHNPAGNAAEQTPLVLIRPNQ